MQVSARAETSPSVVASRLIRLPHPLNPQQLLDTDTSRVAQSDEEGAEDPWEVGSGGPGVWGGVHGEAFREDSPASGYDNKAVIQ